MNNTTLNENETEIVANADNVKKSISFSTVLFYIYSIVHCGLFLLVMVLLDHQRIANIHQDPTFISLSIAGFAVPFCLRFKSKIRNFFTYITLTTVITVGFLGAYANITNSTIIDTAKNVTNYVEDKANTQISIYQKQQDRIKRLESLRKPTTETKTQNVFEVMSGGEADTALKAFINSPHGMATLAYNRFVYGSNSHIKTTAEAAKNWTYMILFAIGLQLWLHATKKGVSLLDNMKQLGIFAFPFIVIVFSFFGACGGFFVALFTANEKVMIACVLAGFFGTIIIKIQAHLFIHKKDDKGSNGGVLYFFIGLPLFTFITATILSAIKGLGHLSVGGGHWIENFGILGALGGIGFFVVISMIDNQIAKRHNAKIKKEEQA